MAGNESAFVRLLNEGIRDAVERGQTERHGSKKWLADSVRVANSTVTSWFAGSRLPADTRVPALATALGVSEKDVRDAIQEAQAGGTTTAGQGAGAQVSSRVTLTQDGEGAVEGYTDDASALALAPMREESGITDFIALVRRAKLKEALDRIAEKKYRVVEILGKSGSGKSVLAAELIQRLDEKQWNIPGTITLYTRDEDQPLAPVLGEAFRRDADYEAAIDEFVRAVQVRARAADGPFSEAVVTAPSAYHRLLNSLKRHLSAQRRRTLLVISIRERGGPTFQRREGSEYYQPSAKRGEALLSALRGVIEDLMALIPDLRFVITSHSPLGLPGTAPVVIPNELEYPGEALLMVREVCPEVDQTDPHLAAALRGIERWPDAVRLLAGMLRDLSPQELAARVADATGGATPSPLRGRLSRDRVFALAFAQLESAEKERPDALEGLTGFALRLSVIERSFTEEAAFAVGSRGESKPGTRFTQETYSHLLRQLVGRGWITPYRIDEPVRWRMTPVVRDFLLRRLYDRGDAAVRDAERAHGLYYAALCSQHTPRTGWDSSGIAPLYRERHQIDQALRWATASDRGDTDRMDALQRIVRALCVLHERRGYAAYAAQWIQELIEQFEASGGQDASGAAAGDALAAPEYGVEQVAAFRMNGVFLYQMGDYGAATRSFETAARLGEHLPTPPRSGVDGDDRRRRYVVEMASTAIGHAMVLTARGHFDDSEGRLAKAKDWLEKLRKDGGTEAEFQTHGSYSLCWLHLVETHNGFLTLSDGLAGAARSAARALDLAQEYADAHMALIALRWCTRVAWVRARLASDAQELEARERHLADVEFYWEKSRDLVSGAGDPFARAHYLVYGAMYALVKGTPTQWADAAKELDQATDQLADVSNGFWYAYYRLEAARLYARLDMWEEGRTHLAQSLLAWHRLASQNGMTAIVLPPQDLGLTPEQVRAAAAVASGDSSMVGYPAINSSLTKLGYPRDIVLPRQLLDDIQAHRGGHRRAS